MASQPSKMMWSSLLRMQPNSESTLMPFQISGEIQEVDLVRQCLYALQGTQLAVLQLENLSRTFLSQGADMSSHRIPTFWRRSTSTCALGKMLAVIAQSGRLRCELQEFVNYFLRPQSQGDNWHMNEESLNVKIEVKNKDYRQKKKGRSKVSGVLGGQGMMTLAGNTDRQKRFPPFSLVNQAFAAAVKSILQGHLAALNTLAASVRYRRSNDVEAFKQSTWSDEYGEGPVVGFRCEGITLLELFLHTNDLRLQLQVLGAICLFHGGNNGSIPANGLDIEKRIPNGSTASETNGFEISIFLLEKFPKGAHLLTYLFKQLKEADPLHMEILRFLFARACQPYSVFIHSWLYHASVRDPYKEFIVDQSSYKVVSTSAFEGLGPELSLTSLKVREGVSVPCFLSDICTPLLRAGQQLQVLLKLAEAGEFAELMSGSGRISECSPVNHGLAILEEVLSCWINLSSERESYLSAPVLVFSKEKLEELVQTREKTNQMLMEKIDAVFERLSLQHQENGALEQAHESKNVNVADYQNSPAFGVASFALERKQTVYLRWAIPTMDSDEAGGVGKDSTDNKHLPVGSNFELMTLCSPGREVDEVKLGSGDSGPLRSFLNPVVNECSIHSSTSSQSLTVEEQTNLERRLQVEKYLSAHEETQKFLSSISGASLPGLSTNQRRSWKKPCEVVIVHSNFEEDIGSLFSTCEDENDVVLHKTSSFISDYKRGTKWPETGLPQNPFLDQSVTGEISAHDYVLPAFIGVDHSWELDKNKVEHEGFQNSSLVQINSILSHKCNNGMESSSHSLLEDIGPERFFESVDILKLKKKYGHSDSLLVQSSSLGKSLTGFESVADRFWNFEACTVDKGIDMKLSSKLSSKIEENGVTVETLDVRGFDSICLIDNLSQQEIGYKVTEQLSDPWEHHENGLRSNKIAGDQSLSENRTPDSTTDSFKENDASKDHSGFKGKDCEAHPGSGKVHGGSSWETSLKLVVDDDVGPEQLGEDIIDEFEIPLEVMVDKCFVQEILFQYQCVSSFSLRLFHEVFRLQDHLAALRRYFFMETGDWADAFTTALCQHTWCPVGAHQRQSEIQTMLEIALQRSSCEGDAFAERLYVEIEEAGQLSSSGRENVSFTFVNRDCVDGFDFIQLGYKVEWPIRLIFTSDLFKLYNKVFSFLIRAKLAVYALGDIWKCLKEIGQWLKRGDTIGSVQPLTERFRTLLLFRQQIGHFITTLQHYVQSQVLHVVWSRFLYAIHNEVKDILELEVVHEAYLKDALHQCFLSEEMKPIKACIDKIMQCLLDFRSHLCYFGREDRDGAFNLGSDQLYFRVLKVKMEYEKALQQLYNEQLKPESHKQRSLSSFQMCLDFNGFFSGSCPMP